MSKHTPGPWHIGPDDADDCPEHCNSGLALVDTGRVSDWPIARLCEWNNARLIAAAPELYEACRDCANAIEQLEGTPIEYALAIQLSDALRDARAALAKVAP
jgi:hypothetical protein